VVAGEEGVEVSILTLADIEADNSMLELWFKAKKDLHLGRCCWKSSQGIDVSAMWRGICNIGAMIN